MKAAVLISSLAFFQSAQSTCLTGQYSDSGVCTNCPGGQYSNSTTATSCFTCPTSTYSSSGDSSCTDCPTGTTQHALLVTSLTGNSDAASCTTGCQAGYGYDSTATNGCSICAAGQYSNNVTTNGLHGFMTVTWTEGCTACATGYTTDGVTPSSSCLMCAAGYAGTSCSACRTGTTSTAAVIADSTCNQCTDDANGCYGHGTCATSTGVCTCSTGWKGTFCGEFDTATVATAQTTVSMDVTTGETWSADFEDSTSAAYQALETSVSAAATKTFEASASAGYVLKSVTVSFSQSTSTRRRKRSTGSVVAKTALVIEHAKTATSDALTTFVANTVSNSTSFSSAGFTAAAPAITASTDSSMTGALSDGQIIGIVIGVCGAVLLAFIAFMCFAK